MKLHPLLTLTLALLLALPARAQRRGKPAIQEGPTFRVLCHWGDGGAASLALAVAEATWEPTARAYGVAPTRPEDRIRLHLYGSREAFDEACVALEGRTWPSHAGLTSSRYGIAVVLVGEDLAGALREALGPREQDLFTIAHESAHLAAMHLVPEYAQHPHWLKEGLAEEVARQVIVQRAGRRGTPPTAGTREATAAATYTRSRGLGLRHLLAGRAPGRGPFDQYAVLGAWARFLSEGERGVTFRRVLASAHEPGFEERLAAALEVPNLASLGPLFQAWLEGLRPAWGLGPGHLEVEPGGNLLQLARSQQRAWAWRLAPRPAGPWQLRLELSPAPVGRAGAAWVAVARWTESARPGSWSERIWALRLAAGEPPELLELRLGSQVPQGEQRRTLARAEDPEPLRPGISLPLELAWDGQALSVSLDGRQVLRAPLAGEGGALAGSWGLGLDPGGVARWALR